MTELQKRLQEKAEAMKEYTVACRRKIHEMAELSNEEIHTSAFVEEELKSMGLPTARPAEYTVIAVLDTGRPGKKVALRADLDALAVPEDANNLAGPRVCRSQTPDKTCHACGHDAHSAMLLAAAKILTEEKDHLNGTIYFCFEQGEETGKRIGVTAILNFLKEQGGVDTVWAIHVYNKLESGKLCVDAGPRMAGAAGVQTTIVGKSGHGSRPDLAINPVFCAANILPNLASAFANQLNVEKTVTLGITSIEGGGQSSNIIPETATIRGSFRFFDVEEGEKAVRVYRKISDCTAEMMGCRAEHNEDRERVLAGPCINDESCSRLAAEAICAVTPEGTVATAEKWYASESYSLYLSTYPGILCHLGIKNEAYGSGAEHHNTYFDVDEGVLPLGVLATASYAAAFCGEDAEK
ncbi:MAG TPA: amidohydrolase [Candidatus Lachnoclostridium stercorigallinarum]|uniref:Amidohydrolase n=1 Tax=Candidatus Lachnoclostridium stercorigallinarum TaxID=2838634 RepID=A0A9D2K7M8_9FIRM|nr:amidohydrolase [Candidatus Lachnoclostridium stercorigallinarum]